MYRYIIINFPDTNSQIFFPECNDLNYKTSRYNFGTYPDCVRLKGKHVNRTDKNCPIPDLRSVHILYMLLKAIEITDS